MDWLTWLLLDSPKLDTILARNLATMNQNLTNLTIFINKLAKNLTMGISYVAPIGGEANALAPSMQVSVDAEALLPSNTSEAANMVKNMKPLIYLREEHDHNKGIVDTFL